jgi:O-antigen biosynthesis protein
LSLCSIIIVTHNNLDYTRQCIESIIRITRYSPFELIVVDANSTDGTLEYLHSRSDVRLVCLEKNYPYAYSINNGIKVAKGEFLCLLNNDILIVQEEWLNILIECAKSDEKIGIVGPRLLREHLLNGARGDEWQCARYITPDGKHLNIWPSKNAVTPCTYVGGACFVLKSNLIGIVGFFDEGFFFAYDDVDYCLRTWKAGKKVVCNIRSTVVHLVMKTRKAVTEKDYEYNVHDFEDPEKRFYRKHSSEDFERILRQAKGPFHFCLWKIQERTSSVLNLVTRRHMKYEVAHVPRKEVK